MSAKVAKEVEKKPAFGFEAMGAQKVKNITEPVDAFRVTLDHARTHRLPQRLLLPPFAAIAAVAAIAVIALGWLAFTLAGGRASFDFTARSAEKAGVPVIAVLAVPKHERRSETRSAPDARADFASA